MKLTLGTLVLIVLGVLAVAGPAADAAKTKSCTRGGAKLVAADGGVRVVRVRAARQSKQETRREHVLACWTKTGKRTVVNREVDFGLDNIARTRVEIVDARYVGVEAQNEGGVSESLQARIYDTRSGKLLHDSKACEAGDTDDHVGVDDAAFLSGGGMAMACQKLLLFRKAGSAMETLEPQGTWVRQVGVSEGSFGFGQRLFWIVGLDGDAEVTKSMAV
jgi:hypothetical protein